MTLMSFPFWGVCIRGQNSCSHSFINTDWLMVQPIRQSKNQCKLNSVKLSSWAVPLYYVAHDMLHVISAQCVARLTVHVGGSSQLSEEIVKLLNCTFQCDYCYYCYYYYSAGKHTQKNNVMNMLAWKKWSCLAFLWCELISFQPGIFIATIWLYSFILFLGSIGMRR